MFCIHYVEIGINIPLITLIGELSPENENFSLLVAILNILD